MSEYRKAKVNGVGCKGFVKEFTDDKGNLYWQAMIEMDSKKFIEKDIYYVEAIMESESGLSTFKSDMNGDWPKNRGDTTTLKLTRYKENGKQDPIITSIEN